MNVDLNIMLAALIGAVVLLILGRQLIHWWNRKLIDEANLMLRLPVPEIQYTNRRRIIDRLLDDEGLQQRIAEQVLETGLSEEALRRRCRHYAREIVPAFSAIFYFRLGHWLARLMLLRLFRLHVRIEDDEAIDAPEPGSSVVLIMNHRSSIDILLVAYLASRRSTLINTAGEWARMWPLNLIVHWAGDCITDRDTTDVLYKYLYKAFIQMAVRERANMAICPEGELSRDGKMRQAKFGLLSYCVTADPGRDEGLYLIPVGINYDRIPEESQLVADSGTAYRQQNKLRTWGAIIAATAEYVLRILVPKSAQLGNACVSFGRPVELAEWQARQRVEVTAGNNREWISALGTDLIDAVSRNIPVLPSHLLATLLADDPNRAWSVAEIQEEGIRLSARICDGGGVMCVPNADEKQAFSEAIETFTRRRLVLADASGRMSANPQKTALLKYHANSVAHLLVYP